MNTSEIRTNTWGIKSYDLRTELPGRQALEDLRHERQGLVVLKNALEPADLSACQRAVEAHRHEATVTKYPNGTLTTFGPYLARYLSDSSAYFARSTATDVLFSDPTHDLRKAVRNVLMTAFAMRSLEVAREPDGRMYAGAILRLHSDGISNPLHNDNIMRDAAGTGLRLADLACQFSCVVCIQECTEGGRLHHYQKSWEPEDERFKIPSGLGYDEDVVEGFRHLAYKPETGDVYVMNPTYYHAIERVGGMERRTLGFFFGSFDDSLNDAVAWS